MIADSEHVLVSTFEPDAETIEQPVSTGDGRLGFWTTLPNAVERFGAGPIVMVRACNRTGRPDLESPPLEGRAELVTEGPLFDEVRSAVADRHGRGAVGEGMLDSVKGLFGGEHAPAYVVVVNVLA